MQHKFASFFLFNLKNKLIMKKHIYLLVAFIITSLMCSCTPRFVCIDVITTPSGAYIENCDNHDFIAKSPIYKEVINVGRHAKEVTVLAKLDGYEDEKKSITIKRKTGLKKNASKHCQKIYIDLEKEKEEKEWIIESLVKITSDPPGASMYLDGDFVGKTGKKTELPVKWHLGDISREVRFEKNGYKPKRRQITPQDTTISIVLQND